MQRDEQELKAGKESFEEHVSGQSPPPLQEIKTKFFDILDHRQDPKLLSTKAQGKKIPKNLCVMV